MNMMNKVIIEGYIDFDSITEGLNDLEFDVKSTRFYKRGGKGVTEQHRTRIRVTDGAMSYVKRKLDNNFDFVRVDGYLDTQAMPVVVGKEVEFSTHWREGI